MKDLKILFMGTPEFAVPTLKILLDHGYAVPAVVTAPDKPKGRGMQLSFSPVKEFALLNHLEILQPDNLKNENFLARLKAFRADLQVVVAFRMLPESLWAMPSLGTINLHASLLPDYRGAAPINWVIINGEIKTGLTTFFIDREIDTGKIILQEEEPVYPEEDAGSLHDRLKELGALLVLKTVIQIASGRLITVTQPPDKAYKKAPKITKEMCEIDFTHSARVIKNFIQGLSPLPGAWTKINSKIFKLFRVEIEKPDWPGKPGEVITDQKNSLKFKTGEGVLNVLEFQPEGKKRMTVTEFFRGNKL